MKLPFLIYGARDGYGWLNGTEWPLAFRERLRRVAGKLPDFDIGESGSAGVVIDSTDIHKHIAALKKRGIIRRVDPDWGGHWEVTATAHGGKDGG